MTGRKLNLLNQAKPIFLAFTLLSAIAFQAAAQTQAPIPTQEEGKAPSVAIIEGQDKLQFQLANKFSYSVDQVPADTSKTTAYNQMPEKMKIDFQKKRRLILKGMIQVLRFTKFGLGSGSLVADKISWMVKAVDFISPFRTRELKRDLEGPLDWLTETESTEYEPKSPKEKKSISELGTQAIAAIVKGMDIKLWERAPLIANSNEYSLVGSINVMAEGGIRKNGGGGLYDLGLSIGFNADTKAVVFQVFQSTEKFQKTILPFAGYMGIGGKVGFEIAENTVGAEHLRRQGTSEYPLAIPVAWSDTPSSFNPSGSLGIFPPPPFDILLTFNNTHSKTILLRVAMSPVMKGFVSVQSGVDGNKYILQPINQFYNKVRTTVNGVALCKQAHLN